MRGSLIWRRFLLLLIAAIPRLVDADSCAPIKSTVAAPSSASTLLLAGANRGRAVDTGALGTAANNWNQACSANDNPVLTTSGTGDFRIYVDFYSGSDSANGINCSGKCACTDLNTSGGVITGATIKMFEKQGNGASCTGSTNQILTHEVGHALGLDDSNCSDRIMGNLSAAIAPGDCSAVDLNFRTAAERAAPEPPHEGPCGT